MAQALQAVRDAVAPFDLKPVNLAFASADTWRTLQDPHATHSARVYAGIKALESAAETALAVVRLPPNWQGPVEFGEAMLGVVFQCGDIISAGPLTAGAAPGAQNKSQQIRPG
jgi:hypothetical protein